MPAVFQQSLSFNGDPFKVFLSFKDKPNAFFLDSSLHVPEARFSYMGFSPFKVVRDGGMQNLKKEFDKYRLRHKGLAFPAGAVGYLGYDGAMYFGFYNTILAVDRLKKRLIISSFYQSQIKDILEQLKKPDILGPSQPGSCLHKNPYFKSNFTKAGYMKAIRCALEHIRRGDIYQINLSHRIKVEIPHWRQHTDAPSIYKNLRQAFPSEFGAYVDDGRQVILSASPERFLKMHNGMVQVKPMKGTRPRGKTARLDAALKRELLKSPKEIAELLMVTDLERNDLGRVCEYKSITVKAIRTIETYSSVFQATSTIEGRLRRDCDQFDLLQATFPSGSVTGCPKIAAMKIIKTLERGSRGLYTGALGYMSFAGDMHFNVMIRTMFLKPKEITFHVGGGIVADSKPADEWQETWDKARPLIETLEKSFK